MAPASSTEDPPKYCSGPISKLLLPRQTTPLPVELDRKASMLPLALVLFCRGSSAEADREALAPPLHVSFDADRQLTAAGPSPRSAGCSLLKRICHCIVRCLFHSLIPLWLARDSDHRGPIPPPILGLHEVALRGQRHPGSRAPYLDPECWPFPLVAAVVSGLALQINEGLVFESPSPRDGFAPVAQQHNMRPKANRRCPPSWPSIGCGLYPSRCKFSFNTDEPAVKVWLISLCRTHY